MVRRRREYFVLYAFPLLRSVSPPTESRIIDISASSDLADAFAARLPAGSSSDVEVLARFVLARPPGAWVGPLMKVRDAIVAGLGIKTSTQLRTQNVGYERIDIFRIYERYDDEIILGEDDKHLDFRISLLVRPTGDNLDKELVFTTIVHCHNLLGRIYLAIITPFHHLVVRSYLKKAANRGWPRSI